MRKGFSVRAKMPCALSKKVTALDDLQAQIRDITQLGDVGRKFQDFAGVQRRCCFRRRQSICGIYWF
jgi:hypothetical protein